MKWKTFWQIILLMIIARAIIYSISPKYYYGRYEPTLYRANRVTGKVEGFSTGEKKADGTQLPRGWLYIK